MKAGNNYSIKILPGTEASFVFPDNWNAFFSHECRNQESNKNCLKNTVVFGWCVCVWGYSQQCLYPPRAHMF